MSWKCNCIQGIRQLPTIALKAEPTTKNQGQNDQQSKYQNCLVDYVCALFVVTQFSKYQTKSNDLGQKRQGSRPIKGMKGSSISPPLYLLSIFLILSDLLKQETSQCLSICLSKFFVRSSPG